MSGKQFGSLLRTSAGISLEYNEIIESDFSSANGIAYTPPEDGNYRRIDVARTIQFLSQCPGVNETFQTSTANIRLPFSSISESTDDAANGRFFVLKNHGVGNIVIQDSLGTSLFTLLANSMVLIFGNEANTWDFFAGVSGTGSFGPPVSIGLNNTEGTLETIARSDHIHRIDNLTFSSKSPRLTNTTSTLNGTLVLTNTSNFEHVLNGTATGFKYKLPNATTLTNGWKFEIWNQSSQVVTVTYNSGATFTTLPPQSFGIVTLESNGTTNGSWLSFRAYTGTASGILHYKITSSTNFVTSSASDTPITGLSVTPMAGTYAVWNNFDITNTQNNSIMHNSIYYNASKLIDSERSAQSTASDWQGVHSTLTTVQCDGAKVVDTRARTSQGQLTVAGRTLLLIRLGD